MKMWEERKDRQTNLFHFGRHAPNVPLLDILGRGKRTSGWNIWQRFPPFGKVLPSLLSSSRLLASSWSIYADFSVHRAQRQRQTQPLVGCSPRQVPHADHRQQEARSCRFQNKSAALPRNVWRPPAETNMLNRGRVQRGSGGRVFQSWGAVRLKAQLPLVLRWDQWGTWRKRNWGSRVGLIWRISDRCGGANVISNVILITVKGHGFGQDQNCGTKCPPQYVPYSVTVSSMHVSLRHYLDQVKQSLKPSQISGMSMSLMKHKEIKFKIC